MVEKANRWLRELPAWLPIGGSIVFAALWIGQHYQSITDRLDTLEHQMKDVQQYLRTDHMKSGVQLPENQQQDSEIPPLTR